MSERFQFRDGHGLRKSITRPSAQAGTLYVETSMCQRSGIAGWGAVLETGEAPDVWTSLHGSPEGDFRGRTGLLELLAVQQAVQEVLGRRKVASGLTVASRSTAVLAVLRWVFPEAPFAGELLVQAPKNLRRKVQEFEPLVDLHEDVERSGLALTIAHTGANGCTELAAALARKMMEASRNAYRSATS